jgi:hypothetical protein
MAALPVLLIDQFGRRKLLLIGATSMEISQADQAELIKYSYASRNIAGETLLSDFLALAFFPIGMSLIPSRRSAEIGHLRTDIRSKRCRP